MVTKRHHGLVAVLIAVAPGCSEGPPAGSESRCPDGRFACPVAPPCETVEAPWTPSLPEPPEPSGHRGLVGVLDRLKVVVFEDGSVMPPGLYLPPPGVTPPSLVVLPGGTQAAWRLAPYPGGYPVASLWTVQDGLVFRMKVFGVNMDPPSVSVVVWIENPGDDLRPAQIAFAAPAGEVAGVFDGLTWSRGYEVIGFQRGDGVGACLLEGPDTLVCHADLPPRSRVRVDFLLPPWGWEPGPAEVRCGPDLLQATEREWGGFLARAAWVSAPDGSIADAFRSSIAYLILLRDRVTLGGQDWFVVKPGAYNYNSFWVRDAAYIATALDAVGLHEEAEKSLRLFWNGDLPPEVEAMGTWGCRISQHADGRWECPKDEHDGTGQVLWALWNHALMSGDDSWLSQVWPAVERGADWLVSARRATVGGANQGQPHEGLLPQGYGETLYRWGYVLYHDFWGVAGLRAAADMADRLGLAGLAAAYRQEYEDFRAAVDRAVDSAFVDGYVQAALYAQDTWDWGTIAALYPCEVLAPTDARITSTFERMWARRALDLYRFPGTNKVWTYITADWAQALLMRGEWERATTLFQGFMARRSPANGWWEEEFLESGQGTGDDPHGWAAANFLLWVRAMFAREDADGTLHLLSGVPPDWIDHEVPVSAQGLVLPSGVLDLVAAVPLPDGRVQVAWNLLARSPPRPTSPETVRLYLRGRAILSAECREGVALQGDHVVARGMQGSCVLAVEPPVAASR